MIDSDADRHGLVDAIVELARVCAEHDGVNPLSEGFRLALEASVTERSQHPRVHVQAQGDIDSGELTGAAVTLPGDDGQPRTVELFVHPDARRAGAGGAIFGSEVGLLPSSNGDFVTGSSGRWELDPDDDVRFWAHGPVPGQDEFAAACDLVAVRELHRMARAVPGPGSPADPAFDPEVPDGYAVRAFVPGRDDQAWLEVNARAFASHPEQGRITLTDLHQRMAEPWFRPPDLLLLHEVDEHGREGELAAFHWTKIEPPGGPDGEVYVVGVDPSQQGRGLGRVVTQLGLAHLRAQGCRVIDLYVDGDNTAARRTYERLGFTVVGTDRLFARRSVLGH